MRNRVAYRVYYRWSSGLVLTTALVLLLLIVVIFSVFYPFDNIGKIIPTAVFVAVIFMCMAWTPLYVELENESITIRLLASRRSIALKSISSITYLSKESFKDGLIRNFGIGGLFGYVGRFRNRRQGKFTLYATEINNLVLITTRD